MKRLPCPNSTPLREQTPNVSAGSRFGICRKYLAFPLLPRDCPECLTSFVFFCFAVILCEFAGQASRGCSRRLISRGREETGLGRSTSSGRFLFVLTALFSNRAVLFFAGCVLFSVRLLPPVRLHCSSGFCRCSVCGGQSSRSQRPLSWCGAVLVR